MGDFGPRRMSVSPASFCLKRNIKLNEGSWFIKDGWTGGKQLSLIRLQQVKRRFCSRCSHFIFLIFFSSSEWYVWKNNAHQYRKVSVVLRVSVVVTFVLFFLVLIFFRFCENTNFYKIFYSDFSSFSILYVFSTSFYFSYFSTHNTYSSPLSSV